MRSINHWIQWNLYLSFPDNSFSRIRRSISMVPERILFKLWLPHLLFSRIHCFFFRPTTKTMNRGFTVFNWEKSVSNKSCREIWHTFCIQHSFSISILVFEIINKKKQIQWNLYSSFSSGVWKRNNGSWKTIDAGAIVEIGFAQGS
jgi:hypothetical protein